MQARSDMIASNLRSDRGNLKYTSTVSNIKRTLSPSYKITTNELYPLSSCSSSLSSSEDVGVAAMY